MNVQIRYKDKIIKMELEENPTSKALVKQLPLEIKLEDYASNEKIFYPPNKLSTEGSPAGYTPKKGDVSYYAPWGDVAFFYKDFSYSKGLIKLGRIVKGMEYLNELDGKKVTIEFIQ